MRSFKTTRNKACKLYNIDITSIITGAITDLLQFMMQSYITPRRDYR